MTKKNKDELFQLLKNGLIDEFNEYRAEDSELLIDLSEIDIKGTDLPGINLSNTDLTGSDLSECDLTDADFANSNLTSVKFTGSVIKQANFTKTVLAGAKFNSTPVFDCAFAEADMGGADFSESDLTGSDFSIAENLAECIYDSYTIWPDSDYLPDNFDPEYIEDLSCLKDDDDFAEADYGY